MQIAVVPGRLDAVEDARDGGIAVPADAEAVTVRCLGAERRMQALIDQGVRRRVERFFEEDGRSRVREPAAHQPLLSVAWRISCGPHPTRRERGAADVPLARV